MVCSPARQPIPLAARGLPAVLARVGPAGAVVETGATAAGNEDLRCTHECVPVLGQLLTRPWDLHAVDVVIGPLRGGLRPA